MPNGQLTQNGAEQYTPLELTSLEMGSLPVTLAPVSPAPKTMPGTKQAFVKGTKASTVGKMPPAPRRALGSSGRARPRLMKHVRVFVLNASIMSIMIHYSKLDVAPISQMLE